MGKGIVGSYEHAKLTNLFEDVGSKTLSLAAVVNGNLLEPAA